MQVLTIALTAAMAVAPAHAAPTPNNRVPLADVNVLTESFDAGFPGGNWTTTDDNIAGDYDYWGSSAYRTHQGAGSAYAAQVGNALETGTTVFSDGFEGDVGSNWSVTGTSDDTWGVSTYRFYAGTHSMWNAQNGQNSQYGSANNAIHYYDNNMDTKMFRNIPATCTNVTMTYWFYQVYLEYTYDFWYAGYTDGSGGQTWLNKRDQGTGGWVQGSISVPAGSTSVGFRMTADPSVIYEGVYVDDVVVTGDCQTSNAQRHLYDNGMNATMTRAVDITGYESATAQFFYWADTGAGDLVDFSYYSGGQWTEGWSYQGTSGGWALASLDIPVGTTLVKFGFFTDGGGVAEGAYVDDLTITASVAPPTCSASVSPTIGTEGTTQFAFVGGGLGGRAPLRYSWDISDGSHQFVQTPLVTFTEAGSYTGTLTVTDALQQTCVSSPVTLTVEHDFSHVYVGPDYPVLNEGDAVELGATDARGHGNFDFEWSLDSDLCGTVSGPGPQAQVSVSTEAGERTCSVIANYGPASGSMTFQVVHNVSSISITPATATVFEAKSLQLFGRDTFDHPLSLEWSTTCGRVSPPTGTQTTFSASTTGGQVCTVTGYLGTRYTTAVINVEHDASTMVVSPTTGTVTEGGFITLSAKDGYQHPLRASWSVSPETCGSMSVSLGDSSLLQAGVNAGGLTCTVTASAFGYSKTSTITVEHDFATASVTADSVVVPAGGESHITALDAHGHQAAVDWALSPSTCGGLSTNHSATVTLHVALAATGIQCTVRATVETKVLLLTISVTNSPPASIDVGLSQEFGFEGETVTATGILKDAGNNSIDASQVAWTTDCQGANPAVGRSTSVQMKSGVAGSTCTVTATYGSLTKTKTIQVVSAARGTVEISPQPSSIGAGATQTFTVTVVDDAGHKVAPTSVVWHASCGTITGSGASVTYTAPGGAGTCTISATVASQNSESSDSASMAVTGSTIVPIAAGGIVAVGAIAALAMFLRRGKKPKAPSQSGGWTGVAPPPATQEMVGEGEAPQEPQ